jgi:CheY-like chemotaxis protein
MARILLVDDDDDVRTAVQNVLEDDGFEVMATSNGKDAVCAAEAQLPDLTVCDIFMPLKDGFETIRELRQKSPGMHIVAVSGGGASGGMDVLRLARHLGAGEVLYKPLHRAALLGAIQRLLSPKV